MNIEQKGDRITKDKLLQLKSFKIEKDVKKLHIRTKRGQMKHEQIDNKNINNSSDYEE